MAVNGLHQPVSGRLDEHNRLVHPAAYPRDERGDLDLVLRRERPVRVAAAPLDLREGNQHWAFPPCYGINPGQGTGRIVAGELQPDFLGRGEFLRDGEGSVRVGHGLDGRSGHGVTACKRYAERVTRGPGGYGRYNDDPQHVGCPWAKSDMTPCVARDGHLALAGDPPSDCVGCGRQPVALLLELGGEYAPAHDRMQAIIRSDAGACADLLTELVREATEPARGL